MCPPMSLELRALESGMSLDEYVCARLTAEARQPTFDEVLDEVETRTGGSVPIAEAVRAVRADRDSR